MLELTLGLSRATVKIFDTTFDAFEQREEAFTHAALRAVMNYIESRENDQKEEITDLLLKQQQEILEKEVGDDALFERAVIVDEPTYAWLKRIASENGGDPPESVLATGVLLLSVMLEVLKRRPHASLYTFPTTTPIKQIIDGRPQLYN